MAHGVVPQPGANGGDDMSDKTPVPDSIVRMLQTTGSLVDMALNGEYLKRGVSEVGFFLAIFPFSDLTKVHYTTAIDNQKTVLLLRKLADDIESRNIDFINDRL